MKRGVPLPPETQDQIIKLLREGKDYNEIGSTLGIAPNSVGNFLKKRTIYEYMRKTGRL